MNKYKQELAARFDGTARLATLAVAGLVLAPAAAVLGLGIHVAAMPDVARELGVAPTRIQQSVSLYLLAFAAAQLVLWPLAECMERRLILVVGLLAFAGSTLAVMLASAVEIFLVGRIGQGLAAGACTAVSLSYLKGLCDDAKPAHVLGVYGSVVGLMLALAPPLGGFLHGDLGGQAGFATVLVVSLVALGCIVLALPPDARSGRPHQFGELMQRHVALLREREILVLSVVGAAMVGAQQAFVTLAPFVLIQAHGLTPARFGLYLTLALAGYAAGLLAAGVNAGRTGGRRLQRSATVSALLGGALIVTTARMGVLDTHQTALIPMLSLFMLGLSVCIVTAPCVVSARAGSHQLAPAFALLGTTQLLGGALGSYLAQRIAPNDFDALGIVLLYGAGLAVLALHFLRPFGAGVGEPDSGAQ